MPYCPKCKDEFKEDFTSCHDCNVPLVEKLPEVDCEDKDNIDDYEEYRDILDYKEYLEFKKQQSADTPAFLCSANSNMEVNILESLLKSNNIPVLVQWRNGGDALMVYMAMSSSGADLYVPSKLLEKAKTLLSNMQVSADTTDSKDEDNDFSEYAKRKNIERSTNAKNLVILLVAIIVISLLYFVFSSYHAYNRPFMFPLDFGNIPGNIPRFIIP